MILFGVKLIPFLILEGQDFATLMKLCFGVVRIKKLNLLLIIKQ